MNYNPYAAPQAAPPPQAPIPYSDGTPQPWSASEVLSTAWRQYKESWPILVGSQVVTALVTSIPLAAGLLMGAAFGKSTVPLMLLGRVLVQIVTVLLQSFFTVGLVRITLVVARGGKPPFGMLFSGADRIGPMFGATLLVGTVTLLGLVLLIVPGIILQLGLLVTTYNVVDARMGAVEAMRASWEATKGQKGEILVLQLFGFGLTILGFAMCCVGAFFTMPLYLLACTIAYTRLTGRGAPPLPPSPYAAGTPAY